MSWRVEVTDRVDVCGSVARAILAVSFLLPPSFTILPPGLVFASGGGSTTRAGGAISHQEH